MYYFAYGSNLNHRQMSKRCPDSKPRYRANLPDYKLIFTGWSDNRQGAVASIKPSVGEEVVGAIYEISENDLNSLNRREGYPTYYDRINVIVLKEDGEKLEAKTYIKRDQSEEKQPSPEYLSIIQQGYKDWGIA